MEQPTKGSPEFYYKILAENSDVFDLEFLEYIAEYSKLNSEATKAVLDRIFDIKDSTDGRK